MEDLGPLLGQSPVKQDRPRLLSRLVHREVLAGHDAEDMSEQPRLQPPCSTTLQVYLPQHRKEEQKKKARRGGGGDNTKRTTPTIDPRIPQHLVPVATARYLRILDAEDEQAAVARISQEQARPMFREPGLRSGVRLLPACGGNTMRDGVMREGERGGIRRPGTGTGTDVKKAGAEWMDGRRKPRGEEGQSRGVTYE